MAKGNGFLGAFRGSIGDVTFYRRNGEQISRMRTRVVSNPKTQAQTIQRMIFASIVAAYKRLKSIVDHSFEGVQYGAKSMGRFQSINLKRLRAYYPTSADPEALAEITPIETMAFSAKGDAGMSGAGLIISSGSIPSVPIATDDNGVFKAFGSPMAEGETSIAAVLKSVGAKAGDQISVVALIDFGTGYEVTKSRYVVDAEATTEQMAEAWTPDASAEAFDKIKSLIDPAITLTVADGAVVPVATDGEICAVGCIISRKSEKGDWLRSPAVLVNALDEAALYQVGYALPTWEDGGTAIETISERFLNNAELANVGFTRGE